MSPDTATNSMFNDVFRRLKLLEDKVKNLELHTKPLQPATPVSRLDFLEIRKAIEAGQNIEV